MNPAPARQSTALAALTAVEVWRAQELPFAEQVEERLSVLETELEVRQIGERLR